MSACPKCGGSAYVGLNDVECTNPSCEHHADEDNDKTPVTMGPIWKMTPEDLEAFLDKLTSAMGDGKLPAIVCVPPSRSFVERTFDIDIYSCPCGHTYGGHDYGRCANGDMRIYKCLDCEVAI